jgi:hypothetical protein
VIDALHLWALWEEGGPLAAGRQDVVRWLYQNAQAKSVDARQVVPAGYDQLCRIYRVWGLSPWDVSIPLNCREVDESQGAPSVHPGLATWLNELTYVAAYHKGDVPPVEPVSRIVALATVVDYAVATYGRDHLPRLLAALGEHASWQTLIPAVFDVSAAEFEAGWQAYLADQYGRDTQ